MSKLLKKDGNYIVKDFHLKTTDEMFLDCGDAIEVDIRLVDKRMITDKQRRFIFAVCNEIVEDTKGYRTDIYKIKRRLMAEKYGIKIKET